MIPTSNQLIDIDTKDMVSWIAISAKIESSEYRSRSQHGVNCILPTLRNPKRKNSCEITHHGGACQPTTAGVRITGIPMAIGANRVVINTATGKR